jgi:hypothetical protein
MVLLEFTNGEYYTERTKRVKAEVRSQQPVA